MKTDENIVNEYDDKGNLTYQKALYLTHLYDYDEDNNLIYHKTLHPTGWIVETVYEYDINGKMIYSKTINDARLANTDDRICIYEEWYDINGNTICTRYNEIYPSHYDVHEELNSGDRHVDYEFHWFEGNNETHAESISIRKNQHDTYSYCNYEEWYEYDDKGNMIYYHDSEWYKIYKEYDDRGNLIHVTKFDGEGEYYEKFHKYDENNNMINTDVVFKTYEADYELAPCGSGVDCDSNHEFPEYKNIVFIEEED